MPGFSDVAAEGSRIAREIVQISSNSEMEDLREAMVQRLVMKEFLGKTDVDPIALKMTAISVITLLASALGEFADEIASKPAE